MDNVYCKICIWWMNSMDENTHPWPTGKEKFLTVQLSLHFMTARVKQTNPTHSAGCRCLRNGRYYSWCWRERLVRPFFSLFEHPRGYSQYTSPLTLPNADSCPYLPLELRLSKLLNPPHTVVGCSPSAFVEREGAREDILVLIVLCSGSSDIYNTCVWHSHLWPMRLIRLTALYGNRYRVQQIIFALIIGVSPCADGRHFCSLNLPSSSGVTKPPFNKCPPMDLTHSGLWPFCSLKPVLLRTKLPSRRRPCTSPSLTQTRGSRPFCDITETCIIS